MKKLAFVLLWVILAFESVYIIVARFFGHAAWGHLAQPLAFVFLFGVLAVTEGRIRWITGGLRIVIGLEFILSVADRFGLLGSPGHGVSWGDFSHFVAYTRQVNAFLPATFAAPLAVAATVCETTLGMALILGIRPFVSTRCATALLCLFGTAMLLSGLLESQFFYGVFVLAAGAWAISESDASWLGVTALA